MQIFKPKIGIIGFGEAGQALSDGLTTSGYQGLRAYDNQIDKYIKLAQSSNVELYNSKVEFINGLDIVFSLVPCSVALSVAQDFIPLIKNGAYIDLTASSPADMELEGELAQEEMVDYFDGAIMGSVINFKHKVPIYLSGLGNKQIFKNLKNLGMNIKYVGELAGQASATKLCRSIYTKGTEALLLELMKVTDHYHITDIVLESIDKTWYLNGFISEVNRLIESNDRHIKRKYDEIVNVVKMMEDLDLNVSMTQATKNVLSTKMLV